METVYRDYAPKGVTFYYLYKALAHPELDGYVTPFTKEERLLHIAEAKAQLGTEIPWLADTMEDVAKHAFGNAPNAEFVFDREARLVVKRRWSDPEALRDDLERLVGPVDEPTSVSDLDLPERTPSSAAPTGVVERIGVPWGMVPLKTEPIPDTENTPFYAKLRAEAERSLLRDGTGKLYLGFHLDPLYKVHWNNEVAPVRFELETPPGVTADPYEGEAPKVEVNQDADPREFLIEVTASQEMTAAIRASVYYFACDDAETFCVPTTQRYDIQLERDRDGGRRLTGRGARNTRERLLEYDANGDGEIVRDELPERMRQRFDRMDANQNGILDENEFRRGGPGRPGQMMERLLERDQNGDGRISREEAPERMRRMFQRLDANGDGFIDPKELDAMRERRQRQRR